jgi:hypothetical protein
MVKTLSVIEEQASKKVTHFRGQIPAGFEVLQRGYSCPLGVGSERSEPQNNAAHLFSS